MTEEIKNIQHIISATQLKSVRLVELTAKSSIRSPREAGKIDVFVDTSVEQPILPQDEIFHVRASINTTIMSQDKTVVSILATFELSYLLPGDVKVTEGELNDFARINATFNVWPYWREFVQNTVTRMNLPPVVLPLFRLKVAVKQLEVAPPKEALPA